MITDEMIAEAVAKYNDALVQYWQNVEMKEHEFSPQFERKMRRLIWKVKYPYMHKALKSVACILIAFLISFASVLTFNIEARATFVQWLKEVYEDSIVYEFFGEKSETASLDYRITWVPEGYELVDEYKSDMIYSAIYENSDIRDVFVIEWSIIDDKDNITLATYGEEYQCVNIEINDCKGEFYKSSDEKNSNALIWVNETETVVFSINSYFSLDEMKLMAENIKNNN